MIPSLIIVAALVVLFVAWTVSRRRGRGDRTAPGPVRRDRPPLEDADRESLLADPHDEQAEIENAADGARHREEDRSLRGGT
jgi:hypothetical protein